MFTFGFLPFILGYGLGTLTAPRYVPSYPYAYAPYPYRGWY